MSDNINKHIFSPFANFEGSQADLDALMENEMVEIRNKVTEIENKKKQVSLEEEAKNLRKKFKKSQNLYEEYDAAKFESKTRVDLLFFEHVCQNLPEIQKMPELLSSYYRTVRSLYEMVNIRPESHRMLNTSILHESYDDQQKVFAKILSEHINNNYYRINKEARKEKFINESQEYASILIDKGLNPQESIQISVKASLLESLIGGIAIPKFIQRRINFLCEDVEYGKVFDQAKLKRLWESFKVQTKNVSRVLAAAV